MDWLGQFRRGNRQVIINQLKAHHRQPAPRIVAGDHAVRHTDSAGGGQPTTQRPPHHGLRFSDVGHQVHPTLTVRANDAEFDGHHQLAEQIRSDVDFIGAAALSMWRDRLQFDREHRFMPRPRLPTTLVWAKAHTAVNRAGRARWT